jgi:hypothetical protein
VNAQWTGNSSRAYVPYGALLWQCLYLCSHAQHLLYSSRTGSLGASFDLLAFCHLERTDCRGIEHLQAESFVHQYLILGDCHRSHWSLPAPSSFSWSRRLLSSLRHPRQQSLSHCADFLPSGVPMSRQVRHQRALLRCFRAFVSSYRQACDRREW